ncbi:MAG: hypothetical protein AAFO95_00950 [Cyanobacteria bacterium J06600_6]
MKFRLVTILGISFAAIFSGINSWGIKPAVAEAITDLNPQSDFKYWQSQTDRISPKTDDLFWSAYRLSSKISIPAWQLAQKGLDLEKFCQDYPYNSQCDDVTPSSAPDRIEVNPSPVKIPVPQINQDNRQSKSGWAIVPEVSTLGLGGHIVRKISPNFNARVGVNAFGLGIDIEETEFEYEGDLNLFNVSTLVDLHPFKSSGFRLSAGAFLSNNTFDGTANVSDRVADELGDVEIDGQTVDIRDLNIDELATIDADIDINNSVSPYLGIGGGNAVGSGKGLGFWWNLGVVFSGSPEVEISSNISDDVPESLRAEVEEAADRALESEEEDLEDELDFINIYPVVSLGFSYQF